jgi:formylglycine-generating enzyme required for sulfatase activity
MVLIPAGEFLMGSDPAKDRQAYDNELPQHTLCLPDYHIAKTPVTYA